MGEAYIHKIGGRVGHKSSVRIDVIVRSCMKIIVSIGDVVASCDQ